MAILVPSLGLYILLSVTDIVAGRILRLNTSDNLISDGVDADAVAVAIQPPFLNSGSFSSLVSSTCVHTYGFFPCADNIGGYIFQIVVYQYLLIIGGKLISRGSKRLFNILGTGVYGATIFRILTVLPKIAMVVVSGVRMSKESAQESVSFGVGVYAGSTVFNLTLVWGMCVIVGRKELFANAVATDQISVLSQLKDTGITIDKKTCYTAGIMLLSLIPYTIVQLANVFNSSFGTRMVILIALVVSTVMLLSYFLYQTFDPWIQERSLEYSKYENLLVGFLQHVQRHAKEKLVDDNGQPNIPVIKSLFEQTDKDADRCITFHELEKLIAEIQSGKTQVEKSYAISEMLKTFDLDKDGRIEEHEFIEGCSKWIDEATLLAEKGDSETADFLREVVQPFSKKRRFEKAEIEHLMARILKHAQSEALEAEHLVLDDGKPNVDRIKAYSSFDDELISDGINGAEASVTTGNCSPQYGFLPCAENAAGYVFMIVVYQVFLIVGGKLIGSGSEVLFYITGPEFGGILFRILKVLPSMMLMIISGIFSNTEDAQSQVSVAVGVYAGVTVFSLTVQWFMCMVSASKSLKEDSGKHREEGLQYSNCFPTKEKLRILIDNGVKVDKETCKTAGIMLLSLIPYLVLQLVYVFPTSSGKRLMTLLALIVSSLSVILYFAYQIWNPWMQQRSLDYSKFDIVQRRFVEHVEKLGKVVKEDGTLDVDLIKKVFDKADQDADRCIAGEELEKLMTDVFKAGTADFDQHEVMNKVLSKFDKNLLNKKEHSSIISQNITIQFVTMLQALTPISHFT